MHQEWPTFIQIPGPNPILRPGAAGTWDDALLEACDILRDGETCYLYYHATSARSGYQIGVVTAPHPLGPFTRPAPDPVLPVGAAGAWDSACTACAAILKEGDGSYCMFYSAKAPEVPGYGYSIGLARADNPLGPWRRHEANPLLWDCGYVGGVVLVDGVYHLYAEHPIGARGPDYGPLTLFTAPAPEGPWTQHESPILLPGEWGEWDDGGFSESRVVYQGGVFHLWYSGAKLDPVRIRTRESIGYARSEDGRTFRKHSLNPVARRSADPGAAAFAEAHTLWEPPFAYCYHTLRYATGDVVEHLGVQALAVRRPFTLTMPVLEREAMAAGETTGIADCPAVALGEVSTCAWTMEASYGPEATAGLSLQVRASHDGVTMDTESLHTFTLPCRPGETVRATWDMPATVNFARCVLHSPTPVTAVKLVATLRG